MDSINFFDLPQMVQIVAAHGLDDGPEGHHAALRVGHRLQERLGRQGVD